MRRIVEGGLCACSCIFIFIFVFGSFGEWEDGWMDGWVGDGNVSKGVYTTYVLQNNTFLFLSKLYTLPISSSKAI